MAKTYSLARRIQGAVLAAVFPATLTGLVINNEADRSVYDQLQDRDFLTHADQWSEDAGSRAELRKISVQIQANPGRGSRLSDSVSANAVLALLASGDESDYRFLAGGLVRGGARNRSSYLLSPSVLKSTMPEKIVRSGLDLWDGLSEHERFGYSLWISSFEGRSVSPMAFARWGSVAQSKFLAGERGQGFFQPEVVARFSLGHDVSRYVRLLESDNEAEREFGARFLEGVPSAESHYGLKQAAIVGLASSDPVVRAACEVVLDRMEGRGLKLVASQ